MYLCVQVHVQVRVQLFFTKLIYNINQITLIFYIQGVFNLPGRSFRQRITLTSSVPMTLNDVIVHVRQFVIALVSVDGCSSFPDL